ncbi:S1 family peptidase [Bdellovibrio sp. HCB-162]|uniref:S1 family peptidase n=1 Tax=Bdellovibrio sp. HCB-162 TaxID=3394234 RepID=UPI0039BC66D9
MKKFVGLGVGAVLSVSLLAGCSSSKDASAPNQCVPASQMDGIIGGVKVSATDLLAKKVVLLVMTSGDQGSICTGTPISKNVILTAAHCVKNADKVTVVFHTDITCESGFSKDKQSITASDFLYHKDYSGQSNAENDVALVKLPKSIPADYQVSKIYDGKSPLSSDEVTLAGYGITSETGEGSMFLRTTKKSFKSDLRMTSTNVVMSQPENGICSGDSGGPVFVEVRGELQILGVNSVVTGRNEATVCHGRGVSMYAPYYQDWVERQTPNLR